jgi:hypothetical protein
LGKAIPQDDIIDTKLLMISTHLPTSVLVALPIYLKRSKQSIYILALKQYNIMEVGILRNCILLIPNPEDGLKGMKANETPLDV